MTDLDLDKIEAGAREYLDFYPPADPHWARTMLALIAELREARESKERAYRAFNEQSIARSKAMDCGCSDHDGACGECVTCWSKTAEEAEERAEKAEAERDEALFNLHNADAYEKRLQTALAEARAARTVPGDIRMKIDDVFRYGLKTATMAEVDRVLSWLATLDAEPQPVVSGGDSGGLRADKDEPCSLLDVRTCVLNIEGANDAIDSALADRFVEGWEAALEAAATEVQRVVERGLPVPLTDAIRSLKPEAAR